MTTGHFPLMGLPHHLQNIGIAEITNSNRKVASNIPYHLLEHKFEVTVLM